MKLTLTILVFVLFSTASFAQQDTCIEKDRLERIKNSASLLIEMNGILFQQVDLQSKSIQELVMQKDSYEKIIADEKTLRQRAEKNMMVFKDRSDEYYHKLQRAKKSRWFYTGAGAATALVVTILIIK